MSYGLNVEMHKQTEICKRLNAIIVQMIPLLTQDHQQQVATAVERAKQITVSELNTIIGQQRPFLQMNTPQIPNHPPNTGIPLPMPHPALSSGGMVGGPLGIPNPTQHLSTVLKQEIMSNDDVKSNSGMGTKDERHVSFNDFFGKKFF